MLHPTVGWEIGVAVSMPLLASYFMNAAILTEDSKRCYHKLKKPPWTPPVPAVQVAWTVLLVCVAVASWMVWGHGGAMVQALPLSLYLLMLLLALAWGPLLLRARLPQWALACACVLVTVELAVFYVFSLVIGPLATLFLIGPMLLWSCCGAAFTWAVVLRNPPGRQEMSRSVSSCDLATP